MEYWERAGNQVWIHTVFARIVNQVANEFWKEIHSLPLPRSDQPIQLRDAQLALMVFADEKAMLKPAQIEPIGP